MTPITQTTLAAMTDGELAQVIEQAQTLLTTRAEKRKADAMEEIRRLAASVQIQVRFDAGLKPKASKATMLKAGERYINPDDPSRSYTVGKGKPPNWFTTLRDRNRLPIPIPSESQPKEN